MNSKMKRGFEGCFLIVGVLFLILLFGAAFVAHQRREQYMNPNYPKQTLDLHLNNGETQRVENVVKYIWVIRTDRETREKTRVFIVTTMHDSTLEFDNLKKFEVVEETKPATPENKEETPKNPK